MAVSFEGLQLLQAIALRGSLSAAGAELGYTQSAASRQLAALERTAGRKLVNRGPRGASLTQAGTALLPFATAAIDALASAERVARGTASSPSIRLGHFASAGPALLPATLVALYQAAPNVRVRTQEDTSPALVRAVQSGRLNAAIVSSREPFRPFTVGEARLREVEIGTVALQVAMSLNHRLAVLERIRLRDLGDVAWTGPLRDQGDPTLGIWPSVPKRRAIVYRTDDWLTRLGLIAAGLAVSTVPPILDPVLPQGVLLRDVDDAPLEQRRVTLLTDLAADNLADLLKDALNVAWSQVVTGAP